jgi:hypothetical protein
MREANSRGLSWLAMVLAGLLGCAGCAGFPAAPARRSADEAALDEAKYSVLMFGSGSKEPKVFTGNWREGMTVDDALQESGAKKKYRHMRIDVARQVSSTGEWLKMPATYSRRGQRVVESQNYAIHPGDQIGIRPQSENVLDAFVRSISGKDTAPKTWH